MASPPLSIPSQLTRSASISELGELIYRLAVVSENHFRISVPTRIPRKQSLQKNPTPSILPILKILTFLLATNSLELIIGEI